ncbi:MAG: hypothetical protein AAB035_05500 [Nitrospirota bacterium]
MSSRRTTAFWVFLVVFGLTGCGGGGGSTAPDPAPDVKVNIGGTVGELPGDVARQAPQGGPNPGSISVVLTNTGEGTLTYSIATSTVDGAAWLSVTPISGTLAASTTQTLTVAIDVVTPALVPGTYTGSIVITGINSVDAPATGSPATISVNLTVSSPPSAGLSINSSLVAQDIVTLANTWSATAATGISVPTERSSHTAVWTGSKMLVWGGANSTAVLNTGGIYNAAGNSWSGITTTGAPSVRYGHTAVWTGSKMLIWGGYEGLLYLDTGGVYDLAANTWSTMATTTAPIARSGQTAVWTGSKMIIWGGYDNSNLYGAGGTYNPSTDSWSAIATTDAPIARYGHTAIWTGKKVLVWGGYDGVDYLNTGGVYDPATDSWSPIATTAAPAARSSHTAVWTGSKMLIQGGYSGTSTGYLNTGGAYDPATDSWGETSTTTVPFIKSAHTAVWTGGKMLVWGAGKIIDFISPVGGAYDPVTNSWSLITITNVPTTRYGHTALWTGNKMLIWGGYGGTSAGYLKTGGVYQ